MTPPESVLERELARLCTGVDQVARDVGDIKSTCAVLVERSARTDQDVRDLRQDMEAGDQAAQAQVQVLRTEVEALKARRWPLQAVSILTGLAAAVIALIALILG